MVLLVVVQGAVALHIRGLKVTHYRNNLIVAWVAHGFVLVISLIFLWLHVSVPGRGWGYLVDNAIGFLLMELGLQSGLYMFSGLALIEARWQDESEEFHSRQSGE